MKINKEYLNKFRAHSANEKGEYHLLGDHIYAVANLAKSFGQEISSYVGELSYIAGLYHDLGKRNKSFQNKLLGENKESYNHTADGAKILLCKKQLISALAVDAHHRGLKNLIPKLREISSHNVEEIEFEDISFGKYIEPNTLITRMVLSCLVDADYLDTEAHFAPHKYNYRKRNYNLGSLLNKIMNYVSLKKSGDGELNQYRSRCYDSALDNSEISKGIYRLSIETGGGKSLTGMTFSLKHAIYNGQNRVIYVAPYLSIIEQTAEVFNNIFGKDSVVEHHSTIDISDYRNKVSTENWDAPIVISTFNQFLESLFSNKVSSLRKLHNIANSVIILDEVQFIPVQYLSVILNCLNLLVTEYNCSIILSTATQPNYKIISSIEIKDILCEKLNIVRVEYEKIGKVSISNIKTEMDKYKQCLVVCNTIRNAVELTELSGAYHLSTNMCAAHRKYTLKEIREKLIKGEECRVVSTQVIEAGVDISFPIGFREMGPLDRIIQASGRINRNNEISVGKLFIFELDTGYYNEGEYAVGTSITRYLLEKYNIIECQEEYYKKYFSYNNSDAKELAKKEKNLEFEEVAKGFNLIEDDTISVLVNYNGGIEINYCDINIDKIRKMQQYVVNLKRKEFYKQLDLGNIECGEINIWKGEYCPRVGLKRFMKEGARI